MTVFIVGVLFFGFFVGLEPGTIGKQTNALTVRPFNAHGLKSSPKLKYLVFTNIYIYIFSIIIEKFDLSSHHLHSNRFNTHILYQRVDLMDKTLGLSAGRSGVRIPGRGKSSLKPIAVDAMVSYPLFLYCHSDS